MNKLRALIIDDAAQARKLLRLMLESVVDGVEVVGEAAAAEEGQQLVSALQPDVVFLDIEMPGQSGIQLATHWAECKEEINVVFTTAYSEYGVTAFRLSAVDYLLKPIKEEHLREAVEKIRKEKRKGAKSEVLGHLVHNLTTDKERMLTIPVIGGFEFARLDDILRIEADGSYARVIQKNRKPIVVAKNLKYFETALSGDARFLRVHRSFLINVAHVSRFTSGRSSLIMTDGTEIDVARERKEQLLARMAGKPE